VSKREQACAQRRSAAARSRMWRRALARTRDYLQKGERRAVLQTLRVRVRNTACALT
jgi:hypothetical protein